MTESKKKVRKKLPPLSAETREKIRNKLLGRKRPVEIKKKISQALLGNNRGTKLKDADVRQEAYKQFCQHIAEGYPIEAFHFRHDEHSVCWKTMEKYIKESPSEFPTLLLQEAKAKRFKYWFGEGKQLMQGQYKCGSPVVWQTIMRNMFKEHGWDKKDELESLDTSRLDDLMNFLSERLKKTPASLEKKDSHNA